MSSSKPKTLAMLPWFPRDYLAATRHLTLAERGAYTDLLFFSWDSGGPLPKDPTRLAALINCTPKAFSTIWPALREKFVETEAGYINARLETERRRSLELREKASEKASAAARAKWDKARPTDAPSNARSMPGAAPKPVASMLGAMLEQCPPTPTPTPTPSIKPPDSETAAARTRARPASPDGPRARPNGNGHKETRDEILERVRSFARRSPDAKADDIAQMFKQYRLTAEEVQQAMSESDTKQMQTSAQAGA